MTDQHSLRSNLTQTHTHTAGSTAVKNGRAWHEVNFSGLGSKFDWPTAAKTLPPARIQAHDWIWLDSLKTPCQIVSPPTLSPTTHTHTPLIHTGEHISIRPLRTRYGQKTRRDVTMPLNAIVGGDTTSQHLSNAIVEYDVVAIRHSVSAIHPLSARDQARRCRVSGKPGLSAATGSTAGIGGWSIPSSSDRCVCRSGTLSGSSPSAS